jgi:hypothetical protein
VICTQRKKGEANSLGILNISTLYICRGSRPILLNVDTLSVGWTALIITLLNTNQHSSIPIYSLQTMLLLYLIYILVFILKLILNLLYSSSHVTHVVFLSLHIKHPNIRFCITFHSNTGISFTKQ